ncbi:hypothetical protein PSHT_05919 [Puccinia striiformis]|uniref:Uncharacterized protein n=1 Tax=Puccinia striiformis TaxID=27350 RepID=A0A2S4W9C3_9BASI|nr:hypothetical protein PSHT_05919 [Puccinia striiformis]
MNTWFTKTLQYPDALVSFSSLALLLTGLKKARKISDQLEVVIRSTAVDHSAGTSTLWSKLLLAFQQSLQAVLPDSQVLIAILQTSSRRANESKSASVGPPEHSTDESQPNTATRTQKENDTDGDIVAFGALAVLLLYHQLIPQTMRNLNFDHTKLIPTFFKLNLNDELDESQSSSLLTLHRLQSPIAYLCQSRTLPLIGHSASTNPTQPSPALVKVLLLLSSFPLSEKAADSDLAHTPVLIRDIAQETLQAICKSIVPHLRDESEYQALYLAQCIIRVKKDCIRACLRQPLKYLQISEERRNHSTEPMIGARPPTLISALLAKVNAITKGSSTSSTNPSRVALISLVIKFLNLYLFMVLSTSHQTRPITMPAFSVTMSNQADAPSTYPDYLGDAIMNILRSATQLLNSATESCHKAISWPSYITQSIFSDQVSALDLMHQSFSFTNKKPKPSKTKKAVAFMDLDSTTTSATFIENGIQSRHHQMEFLRFITRAVEVDMFGIGAFNSEGASANIEQLDYETKASNIKVLVGIISKSFSNDPAVIECFLEEMWHIAQLLVEKRDFELLMGEYSPLFFVQYASTLCKRSLPFALARHPSCGMPGLDKTKAESIKVLTRYSDLISDSALPSLKSKIKKGKSTAKDNALLVALLSSVNPELLGDANCASSITKLVNLTSGLPPQEKQWHLDQLSIDPVIRTLCVLSNTTSSKVATEMLLEIIEQSSDTSRNSDELAEAWSMYSLEVFGSCSTEHSDFGTKLRITSYLARKNKKITLAAITWLSQTPIDQLKLAWDGTLSLLVACLENQTKDDARYDACLLPLGKRRLDELIITIGSCLFSGNDQTPPSVLPNGKETRLLACKALKLIYSSTESLVEQLLADQMTQSGVIPAYSESLDVLSSFRSNHLDAYIDRCLSWLVRRFAEDETCTEDTIRLVESLHAIVARKPAEYALSTHLVNPVLTAALDRLIDSGCVMKLMDLFIRHTNLEKPMP